MSGGKQTAPKLAFHQPSEHKLRRVWQMLAEKQEEELREAARPWDRAPGLTLGMAHQNFAIASA